MTQPEEGYFSTRDGLRLFFQIRRPAGPARAHVAVLHGYADHLGRYGELTSALNAAGYAAHLFDQRGHGQSGGKRAFVERFDDYLDDLRLFLDRVRKAAGTAPVFLAAHSNGALIAARFLLDEPEAVRGAILSSPYLRLKLKVSPLKVAAGKIVQRFLPALPMKNELKVEDLTRDVAIQQATRGDPLYQSIATPRWFTESSAAQETVLRRASELVTPFLCLVGGADGIADPAAARELYEGATAKDKQFKQYDGLLHEVFHEPERDLVFKDVVAWLDARVGTRDVRPQPAAGERA